MENLATAETSTLAWYEETFTLHVQRTVAMLLLYEVHTYNLLYRKPNHKNYAVALLRILQHPENTTWYRSEKCIDPAVDFDSSEVRVL